MSRDGRIVANAGTGPDVCLWDVSDPAHPVALGRAPLGDVGGFVRAVALSPDGRVLAVGGADGHLRFWSLADPKRPAQLAEPTEKHDNAILSIAYSPDGHTLATAGGMTVQLWDVSDPDAAKSLGAPLGGFNTPPYVVRFSPTRPVLAVGNGEGIGLVNVADPRQATRIGGTLVGQIGQIRSLAFSADGAELFSGGTDRTVRRWTLDPERIKAEICARTRGVLTAETWIRYVSADLPFDPPCGTG
jgi:WD40 repeat protein